MCKFPRREADEVTSYDFHDLWQGSMTLQEYLQSVMKLRARAPNVADQSIIDSVVKGINLGPCGEYISRRKPNTRILHIRPGKEEKARGEERAEVAKQREVPFKTMAC